MNVDTLFRAVCASRSSVATGLLLPVLLSVLAGCAQTAHRAPVEDRKAVPTRLAAAPAPSAASSPQASTHAASPAEPPKPPLMGAENAGKPGYYTVKPGDTLIRLALDNGQNWRDVARWNGIDNPDRIESGQVLRMVPPSADGNGVVVRPIVPAGRVDGRTLEARPALPAAAPMPLAAAPPPAVVAAASAPAAPAAAPAAASRDAGEDDINWMWPASGAVGTPFDDNKSKGLAITGKAGDPVFAAADGRVVYAGAGLRGYGNLVIVKHNATYLTAYAHNQALLVREDQPVRRGQKIAEMGSSDADRVQLHFEIRRQGKPIDPAKLLPAR